MSLVETEQSKMFFITIENNILYCSFDSDIIIDERIIKEVILAKNSLIEDKNIPFIIDFRQVKYFLQSAKDLFFSKEGFLSEQPLAVILNSLIIQTSINFMFNTNTIETPFKMCINEDRAEQCIEKILQQPLKKTKHPESN